MSEDVVKLWEHQKRGVKEAKEKYALFWEQGVGKTFPYLEICKKYNSKKALLLVPRSLIPQWKGILKTYPLGDLNVVLETFDRAANRVEEYRNIDFDAIVVDEASKIKRWGSKRARNLCRLSSKLETPVRIIGTGTPISNARGLELYAYSLFLHGGDSVFGESYTNFRKKYFDDWGFNDWWPKEGAEDALYEAIEPWSSRILKSECVSLPPKLYTEIRLRPLRGASRKAYDALHKHGVAVVNGRITETPGKAVVSQKLRQLTQGVLYDREENNEFVLQLLNQLGVSSRGELDNPKLEWLLDSSEELEASGGDILIVGNFTRSLYKIAESLERRGHSVGRFFDSHRVDLAGSWKFLVANESTIAFGHNLQRISTVIFFGNSTKLEERRQTEDRAYRPGQRHKVTIIDLVVEGIDSYVTECLKNNLDCSRSILRDIGDGY